MINLILTSGMGKEPSLQGELYTAYSQLHYESLAERAEPSILRTQIFC